MTPKLGQRVRPRCFCHDTQRGTVTELDMRYDPRAWIKLDSGEVISLPFATIAPAEPESALL